MKQTLSWGSVAFIGTMLFGMFFGAGNLIFPVHLGQEAGQALWPAIIGFLVTAIGLPFLGIVAMGVSRSNGLQDLVSRVHPMYGKIFTLLLYITIGPAFAIPRTSILCSVLYHCYFVLFEPRQVDDLHRQGINTIILSISKYFIDHCSGYANGRLHISGATRGICDSSVL